MGDVGNEQRDGRAGDVCVEVLGQGLHEGQGACAT
jgi:hypothetical protein